MANLIVNLILACVVILSTSSCAFFNLKTVTVTVNTDPGGAKMYVDDIYYGVTPNEIDVVPDKTHNLRLIKDGYKTASINMETKLSLRRGQPGYSKCKMDVLGSVFILPIFGATSVYCRDFTQRVYSTELVPLIVVQPDPTPPPTPFASRSYYLPPIAPQEMNQKIQPMDNEGVNQNRTAAPQQPIFNNQSEYINNGNESRLNQNYNNPDKIDYCNWQ